VFTALGDAVEVTKIIEVPWQKPTGEEVSVKPQYSPINPADFLRCKGQLGTVSGFPAAMGGEGVGIVEELGEDCKGLEKGDVVLLPNGVCWTQQLICNAGELTPLPKHIDLKQASMLTINPATASCLLQNVKSGDWIIQNAANSSVGKLIIRLARERKIKTVNVVRRENVVEDLKKLGADVVIVGEEQLSQRVIKETGGARILHAFDAIGGKSAGALVDCLAPGQGAKLIVYGILSGDPLQLPAAKVAFMDITVTGFSRLRTMMQMGKQNATALYRNLAQMTIDGQINSEVEKVYPISNVKEALQHAQKQNREGKVLLTFNE